MKHTSIFRAALTLSALGLSVGCASWFSTKEVLIEGDVSYSVPMVLPPEAVVEVRLLDVSRQDVAVDPLATTRFALNGRQVPVPYRLSVPKAWLQSGHRYALSAQIELFGKPWYVSEMAQAVSVGGGGQRVDVLLVPVKEGK